MREHSSSGSYNKAWSITVQPLHWALMAYYAKRRREKRSETLRALIETVAKNDKTFDPKLFREYVTTELVTEESDGEARDVLLAQVDEFVKNRAGKRG